VKSIRNALALTLAAISVAAGSVALAAPATAATTENGVCESGEFCYYYNSDEQGSMADLPAKVSDLGNNGSGGCYKFKTSGSGQGVCVKNNAASVQNRTGETVSVFYNSGYEGNTDTFNAGTSGNLNSLVKNENAAHRPALASGNDYPYRNSTPPAGTYVAEQWSFYKGECVSFAAWAVVSRTGRINFNNSYGGVHWGSAINWDNAARQVGIPVSTTPKVGTIAVRNSGSSGHVAYVTAVHSNGTFDVDEYNFSIGHGFDHRTNVSRGTATNQFDAFISF